MVKYPETLVIRSDGDGGFTTSEYLSTKHSEPVEYIRKDVYLAMKEELTRKTLESEDLAQQLIESYRR